MSPEAGIRSGTKKDAARAAILRTHSIALLSAIALTVGPALVPGDPHALRRGPNRAAPWADWHDQTVYVQMAAAIAELRLSPAEYHYGLGYPALATPFVALADPFYFVRIALFFLTVYFGVLSLGELFGIGIALLSLGLVALASHGLEYAYLVSWSNAVTYLSLSIVAYVVLTRSRLHARSSTVLGLCVGWTFAARYVDAVFVALPALPLVWRTLRESPSAGHLLRALMPGAIVCLLLVLGVVWSHHSILGGIMHTPYATHIVPDGSGRSDQEPSVHHPRDAIAHLIQAWVRLPRGAPMEEQIRWPPLLQQMPILWLAPIGFLLALRNARTSLRRQILWAGLVAFLLSNAFYGAYYLRAETLKFHSQRYVMMWIPALAGFSWLALRQLSLFVRNRALSARRTGLAAGNEYRERSGGRSVRPVGARRIDR